MGLSLDSAPFAVHLLFDIDVDLIEGNFDSFLLEAVVDRLQNVKVYRPIVGTVDPNPENEIQGACVLLGEAAEGRKLRISGFCVCLPSFLETSPSWAPYSYSPMRLSVSQTPCWFIQ